MGTGKTFIIINNAADLWSDGLCGSVLVLAPNGVHSNWTRIELPKHMPEWVRWRSATWQADASKTEQKEFEGIFEPGDDLRIMSMNWESLQNKRGIEAATRFCRSSRQLMIVCDESDAIKNPSAKRTKELMKLKKYSHWRRIMTGTPITNSPYDAFSHFSFLDTWILGTDSYYAFKAEYAELLRPGNRLYDGIVQRTGRSPQVVARDA